MINQRNTPMEIMAVELRTNKIKIEYVDGSREEVEAGVYERKNSQGNTVEQRPATLADTTRLTALVGGFETTNQPSSSAVTSVEVVGSSIEVTFADGTKEEISNGIYERKNAANETIVERVATASDTARLNSLVNGSPNTSPGDDGTPDQGAGDVGTPSTGDDGTSDQGSGDVGTPSTGDDGTPDQGSGDVGTPSTGDDGTPDQGSGDVGTPSTGDDGTPDQGSGDVGPGPETPPANVLNGTQGKDRIEGRAVSESINGHGGKDDLRGRAGDDSLDGGSGKDRVRGDRGNDTVDGGKGDDDVRGDQGDDVVLGGDGNDHVRGDRGDDTLFGGDGKDRVKGGDGDDLVDGGGGNDRVFGNRGNDTLDGGSGRDTYTGGLGNDVFVFERDDSLDKIADFTNGADMIDLTAYALGGFAQLLDLATERNGDTFLRFGGADVLRIDDVSLSDLDASDFLL
ncbi:Ca2+-binding RTX toxin-like protein [Roseovarius sp. MBR-51]